MAQIKKLYRSSENKTIAGIVGGVGEYFEIDPVLLRLIWLERHSAGNYSLSHRHFNRSEKTGIVYNLSKTSFKKAV